jgi:lactoylglutathione lyase
MALNLTNVRLLVQDIGASVRFYRDKLGFELVFGDEDDVYAEFKAGNATLGLFKQELMSEVSGVSHLPASANVQDRGLLFFAVPDVDAACAELEARGITFVGPPTDRPDWGLRTAHFRDPDGNLIEIGHEIPMSA